VDGFFEAGVSFVNGLSVSQATDRAAVRIPYTGSGLKGYAANGSLGKNILNVAAPTSSPDGKPGIFAGVACADHAAKGRSETGCGDGSV
jgi:hypothetical protein